MKLQINAEDILNRIENHPVIPKLIKYLYIKTINSSVGTTIKEIEKELLVESRVKVKVKKSEYKFVKKYTNIDRKKAEKYIDILYYMLLIDVDWSYPPYKFIKLNNNGLIISELLDNKG